MSDLPDQLLDRLRADLLAARRERDVVRTRALRGALSAIANAEALPAEEAPGGQETVFAGAVDGLGTAEAPRRQLTPADLTEILRGELSERAAAAAELEQHGARAEAETLRAEAAALRAYLD